MLHLQSRRSCQSKNRHPRVALLKHAQGEIVLAEILAPVAHAMNLIYDESVYFVVIV